MKKDGLTVQFGKKGKLNLIDVQSTLGFLMFAD